MIENTNDDLNDFNQSQHQYQSPQYRNQIGNSPHEITANTELKLNSNGEFLR